MKRKQLAVTIVVLALAMGCAKKAVAPVPGQLNTFDAYAYRVLADTQAALNSFKADVEAGKLVATPTLKTALNQAITDYNAANAAYQAWRAAGGTGDTLPVTRAINQAQADVSGVAVLTQNGGKP